MPTDIKLDEGNGDMLVLEARVVKATAADLMIDSPPRRITPSGIRRALVHDQRDGLTINYNADYPGGVTVGGNLQIHGDLSVGGDLQIRGDLRVTGDIWLDSPTGPASLTEIIRELQRPATPERLSRLELTVASMAELLGASIVPPWNSVDEVEEGDDMGVAIFSASSLGFRIQYADKRGQYLQGEPQIPPGEEEWVSRRVLRLTPEAGTMLRRGSVVVVRVDYEE